ncbi:MAG: antibiotic biosynthesis monooxygenase [Rubrivivax sp.]|nr:antibiotic biosynthesis monooxygenase [Rubrivivax sp.]MDP3083854.1 antibiotic biosynthesis monooxygenase [Rubrivivax sp.]
MIAVIFEVTALPGLAPRYFELAAELRQALENVDGFISVERFQSVTRPECFLSLSFWRDADAVMRWRTQERHRQAQAEGSASVFAHYRIRVAEVLRDYGMTERGQAPTDSGVTGL